MLTLHRRPAASARDAAAPGTDTVALGTDAAVSGAATRALADPAANVSADPTADARDSAGPAATASANAAPSGAVSGASAASLALGFSLTDLHMRMNMAHHMQKSRLHTRAAALGLGPGQPRMLSYIGVHAPCTRADLAAHYRIDPAAVTRMLDALERNGFIASVPARPGADRRKKAVELTERGRATLGLWDVACAQADEVMTEGFTPAERAQLSDLLERVCRNLAEADRARAHQAASGHSEEATHA